MATFDATIVRAVAIELAARITPLAESTQAIAGSVSEWVLNGTDPMLPSPYAVRLQIEAYKDLYIRRLMLDEWLKLLLSATEEDTLAYSDPPIVPGQVAFTEIGLKDLNF